MNQDAGASVLRTQQLENTKDTPTCQGYMKKKPYDADAVQAFMDRKRKEMLRRQAEEKITKETSQREQAEMRRQKLQEVYRKQREAVKRFAAKPRVVPVKNQQQETDSRLLLEEEQVDEDVPQTRSSSPAEEEQQQLSGESDEDKSLASLKSPSSSDRCVTDHPASPSPSEKSVSDGPEVASPGSPLEEDECHQSELKVSSEEDAHEANVHMEENKQSIATVHPHPTQEH
ncbi:centrosome-associated protein 350-like [Thalassophryne amazonica]|uniref:centrosome-associated protein 350-like n=1 Tax=Thalassophryne amazonica TaxID=390379 RepID=UPI001470C52B|nr:centrosome-associated protein 350-like [Thalassophryne amazonica]